MAQIIEEIIKKYGLEKIQEEGLNKFFEAETTEKAREILDDLPGAVLSQILRELKAGELTPEKTPEVLHKNLNVSQKIAKEIAKDLLKEGVGPTEEEPLKPPPEKKKPDVYREPIK
jgi:hypothetical protein